MRTLPELCFERPIGTLAVAAALTLVGIVVFARLPINLMPDIVYPMVRVHAPAGGVPPEVLLQTVTRPLELELAQAEGVELIESQTQQGQAQITLSFGMSRDIDLALRDAATLVERVRAALPPEVGVLEVFKFDPQNLPVVEFTLRSVSLDPVALRRFAEEELAYRFIGVGGVASVRAAGGHIREIQVRVDPFKLRGFGLTLADVNTAVAAANVQRPAGRVDGAGRELAAQVLSLFGNPNEIADLMIPLANGDGVPLREVATVLDTHREQRLIVRVNGEEGVKLSVFKAAQANATDVASAVRARLAELEAEGVIPAGVNVAITADESVYIREAIASAEHTFLLALALVALIVLVFLGDWRLTLIALAVLPVGLCLTSIFLLGSGSSINLMSVGGLILGVTLMVDYGLVLLENVARHRVEGSGIGESVGLAAREVGGGLIASLIALLAAVTPFLLLGGTALLFFEEFILTIMFATIAGLVAAFAVIPALWPAVSRFVRHEEIHAGQFFSRVVAAYRSRLDACLARPRRVLAVVAAAVAVAAWGAAQLGYTFLPEIDDGRVTVTIEAEPGTLLADLDAHVRKVEALALARPEVALVDASIGGRVGQSVQEIPAFAEILISLVPKLARDASVRDWIGEFDREVEELELVGTSVRASKARIRAIRTFSGQASFGDFDVVVRIEGQDPKTLVALGEQVRARLTRVDGLADLTTTLSLDQPLMNFDVDERMAAAYGVAPQEIAGAVAAAIDGTVASRFLDESVYYDVRVLNDRGTLHAHLLDLPTLPVRRLTNGDVLLLGQVTNTELARGPLAIDRVNQSTVNMVNGAVRGSSLGEVASDVRAAVADLELPPGYALSFGGRMALLDEGGEGVWWIAALAFALLVVVLAVYYESIAHAVLIAGVVPLGVAGAVLLLWATGTPFSATAFIGLILLVGIAANNAIVLVAYVEQLQRAGRAPLDAIREAAVARLRPKLMTALVAMVGLAPLAFANQEGGEILQPLALAVLGGMPVSLAATLVVLPVLMSIRSGRVDR
jgi:multidrug efflux pump subunit AcrB